MEISQRKGLSRLPTVIFQIIQKLSRQKDYRQLMNADIGNFSLIKSETITYWLKVSKGLDEHEETTLKKIINSVKDKSKQVYLFLDPINQMLSMQYAHVFDGVRQLKLRGTSIDKNFAFEIFNNILHLILSDIQGISCANLYLEKTIRLVIWKCGFTEITEWNSENSLRELNIDDCKNLARTPSFGSIETVSILGNINRILNFQVGQQTKLSVIGGALSFQTLEFMSKHPCFADSAKELTLNCSYPIGFTDFSFCQNITDLDLKLHYNINMKFPPVYNGRNFSLRCFSLSDWTGREIFPNVEKCKLDCCTESFNLPQMPKLRDLSVYDCQGITHIPYFPLLTELCVFSSETCWRSRYFQI
jgi:hypothetical protein